MRVLVVDDSRAIRHAIGEVMQDIGFEVKGASNGAEALECMQQMGTPDLVMTDWNMPAMDGIEFTKAVRSNPQHSKLPLVLVASRCDIDRISIALSAGISDYILKPFTSSIVSQKLQSLGLSTCRSCTVRA